MNVAVHRKTNGWKPFMVNVTADFCQLLDASYMNPFLKILRDWLKKYSNIDRCPLTVEMKKKHARTMQNFDW